MDNISAVVTFKCQYCGTVMQEVLKGHKQVTVVCDNDDCGANYEVSINCKEAE